MSEGLYPKYFVLKPRGNSPSAAASREAMRAYAKQIYKSNPTLGVDLLEWADREQAAAHPEEQNDG